MVEGDDGVFDGDGAVFAELAERAGYGFAGGARHRGHLFVCEEQREAIAAVDVFADLVGEFEKESAEAACDCFSKGDAACVLKGEAVFLAEALNCAHLGFAMIAEEGKEPLAFNGAELG